MESSRIFVKGLPPSFTEAEFKKHFASQGREVTDARLFANRRIGYVGYKTTEDAQKAVKYFNKTFVRMSRIGVEIARPVGETKDSNAGRTTGGIAPTALPRRQDEGAPGIQEAQKDTSKQDEQDPKLKEFLEVMKPKSKKRTLDDGRTQQDELPHSNGGGENRVGSDMENASDEEYDSVPRKAKRARVETAVTDAPVVQYTNNEGADEPTEVTEETSLHQDEQSVAPPAISDDDWARSRTSRLLGILDDDEEEANVGARASKLNIEVSDAESIEPKPRSHTATPKDEVVRSMPTPPSEDLNADTRPESGGDAIDTRSSRLFLRNLPFDVTEDALRSVFASYGYLEEIHIPLDRKTGAAKGFAYLQFINADAAGLAMSERDGKPFQGRILHALPASAKRETKLNEFDISKLPLKKQQQVKKRREAASSTFNWNALYMNADAVVSSVADRLGLSKSEVLDPTSSDAAIKQAHAETHIIQETKSYFRNQGVDLDAFKRSQRGDTAILVKNIPYDCSKDELKRLFEEHGEAKRFLMPPSGTLAIVEFVNAAQAKTAFGALAYRKIKGSVLFLEKAPKDLFTLKPVGDTSAESTGVSKVSTFDLKNADADMIVQESAGTASLFVRNLNFSTTTPQFTETFQPMAGFLSGRVKTRTDPKKPGHILSMGFGFLEFRTTAEAQAALQAMDGYVLHGHKLQIRASHKGADAAEERRREDKAKRDSSKTTKVVIKNLPFETTKKDVRALFGAYGQLRSVRVPKKMDNGARGFAFADFTTSKEAQNAIESLRDTHLLGRRLVLDFAAEEPEDAEAEIERMQKRVDSQVNKVALQKLTSGGRKKFTTQEDEE